MYMNHNIFKKILAKYWKERFDGVLGNIMKNFKILPEFYYGESSIYEGDVSFPFRSIAYLLLHNRKKGVCSICCEKYSEEDKGVERCCTGENIHIDLVYSRNLFKKIVKYEWLYDGESYRGEIFTKQVYMINNYAYLMDRMREAVRLESANSFVL